MNASAQPAGTHGDVVGAHESGAAAGKRKRMCSDVHDTHQRNNTQQPSKTKANKQDGGGNSLSQHPKRDKGATAPVSHSEARVFDPVVCDDTFITVFHPFLEEI